MSGHAPIWDWLTGALGVCYFAAWSISFYPQLLHNYRRKHTDGLSPDFVILNPLGFLFLTIYNFSLYFSPRARAQYAARHHGAEPEVAASDLAFAIHALVISLITLLQVVYYNLPPDAHHRLRRFLQPNDERYQERQRLLPLSPPSFPVGGEGSGKFAFGLPSTPLTPTLLGFATLAGIVVGTISAAIAVWAGKLEWLDWLYFASSVKLVISFVKYIPQIWLNIRLKSSEGFAIGAIILDLSGGFLSFLQLVISSIFISHYPAGIIANPAKLGLSVLSIAFDMVFILQHYVFYKDRRIGELEEAGDVPEERI